MFRILFYIFPLSIFQFPDIHFLWIFLLLFLISIYCNLLSVLVKFSLKNVLKQFSYVFILRNRLLKCSLVFPPRDMNELSNPPKDTWLLVNLKVSPS
jgi:hypothetical protein